MDQEWREYFSSTNIPMRTSTDEDEKRQFMIESVTIGQSLQEFLLEQSRLSEFNEAQIKNWADQLS